MAEFAWEARARTGETRKGVMEAETQDAVENRLRAQQLNPVKIKKKAKDINITFGSGVDAKELVQFVRQFATMI
ncbi:MAG: type II secretion system F family protein, partial [Polyangiales bacterium]